ncbi:ornithine carbamoyltransferase [Litorilinea aerophila]|uniref:Ornithine carbamoyltransferase n=1 Tax=Litorilinea aerophila TaxID=1204385 RepID=A0A540VBD6_9CHLR|nr:ornithine carbamoyltransferase [Litorilinea aerophila]MCC9078083.1 ornithine carbamoyltransferase [Litorilinea aerophila]OUC07533.1 ornithine carbamoyltransferase [Litorilinea aerophila]GIV77939.1 MAG: ornithine carbamoyltransferase [Litorilinea sp.]
MAIPALQHFLDIQSLTDEQFWGLLRLARELKDERIRLGQNAPILAGKSLAMVFQKPSLRTRVSFEMGMQHLGGHAFYISPQEVGLGTRESVPDVARVLSGYADGIMARVFDHEHILQLAEWGSVPVINGLSDFSHPCQALADLFTIWEELGQLAGLTLVYVGDGSNNVATSLVMAAAKVGLTMRVVAPPGYQPDPAVLAHSGTDVTVTDDLDGVVGADILYTDVWTSMGQESEREERLRIFPPYQVNGALVDRTRNPDVKVMHCLPAHRGEEITDDVADGPHSLLFPQAHNRLHAQKAILAHLLGGIPLK